MRVEERIEKEGKRRERVVLVNQEEVEKREKLMRELKKLETN